MAKVKRVVLDSYTTVSNCYLNDKTLGMAERGLLTTMLSLESNPNWNYSGRGFMGILPDGRDRIFNTLRKLEEAGYLQRTKIIEDGGRIKDTLYEFCDHPIFPKREPKKKSRSANVNSQFKEGDVTASFAESFPCPEKPYTVNQDDNIYNISTESFEYNDGDLKQKERSKSPATARASKKKPSQAVSKDEAQALVKTAVSLSGNQPIPSELKRLKNVDDIRDYVKSKIVVYDFCVDQLQVNPSDLDEVVDILVEMLDSDRQWIGGKYIGIREVRKQLCELNSERIAYIMSYLNNRSDIVVNRKAYIKTALMNSSETLT